VSPERQIIFAGVGLYTPPCESLNPVQQPDDDQHHDGECLAHVYAAGCPPFPYPVSGGYVSRGVILMHGAAPVVDPYTCTVLWYTWDSANAHPSYSLVRAGGLNRPGIFGGSNF